MNLDRVMDHVARVRSQFGRPLLLGQKPYKVRGYISNDFPTSMDHEPHLVAALGRALRSRSGMFLDIGANLGQTLTKLLCLDPERKYLGFEPQVSACFFLSRFIADNGLSSAQVLPIGLSDENGIAELHLAGESDTMGSLLSGHFDGPSRTEFIQTRVGDEILDEMGLEPPGIIKVDVEGAELRVLRGLDRTLKTIRPIVFFEVLPNHFGDDRLPLPADIRKRRNENAGGLWDLLAALGYEVQQILQTGEGDRVGRFDLDDAARYRGCDYVAYPT